MKLIIFDVYGTLISTGTGSLDAVKKILALQDKMIDSEEFYREWKKHHRIHMDHANAVYTSEIIRKYKPDPAFYQYILEKEKCGKEDAVFVGDSYVDDVCGPGRVGMKSILIDRRYSFHCEENGFEPWRITDSLENILELVSR